MVFFLSAFKHPVFWLHLQTNFLPVVGKHVDHHNQSVLGLNLQRKGDLELQIFICEIRLAFVGLDSIPELTAVPRGREFPKCPVWDQFGDGAVVIGQLIRITWSGEGKRML